MIADDCPLTTPVLWPLAFLAMAALRGGLLDRVFGDIVVPSHHDTQRSGQGPVAGLRDLRSVRRDRRAT